MHLPFKRSRQAWKRGFGSADAVSDPAAAAQDRLRKSVYRELRGVACDFHEGVLTLRGSVSSYYLKQLAQTLVFPLDGVEECVNRLDVRLPTRAAH